ncbi:hypothetical protein [Streptomyces shaanxiensis]|uniref:Uncharacterized protein n=1 Tax=Streptomyces shaanxiensis TaxID=653357 RepID=A0ABP7UT58_9ACTN
MAETRRGPQSPTARWDFDERGGTVTREAATGSADPIDYARPGAGSRSACAASGRSSANSASVPT